MTGILTKCGNANILTAQLVQIHLGRDERENVSSSRRLIDAQSSSKIPGHLNGDKSRIAKVEEKATTTVCLASKRPAIESPAQDGVDGKQRRLLKDYFGVVKRNTGDSI